MSIQRIQPGKRLSAAVVHGTTCCLAVDKPRPAQ